MKKFLKIYIYLIISLILSSCGSKDSTSSLVSNTSADQTQNSSQQTNPNGPAITSFIAPANGTYADGGGVLLFQINFDEEVEVTGTPYITIRLGLANVYAYYQSGSTTTGLEFSYTIQAGDNDNDGISLLGNSIALGGGTIKSVATAEDANLDFTSYLSSMVNVLVDTSSGITPPDQVIGVSTAPTTSNTSLSVTWSVPNNNGTTIINYTVQYRQQGQSTWITANTPTTNSATINSLSSGVQYEIRIAANNGLLGSYSAISTAEIFDIMSLNPIAWLSATNITNGGVEPSDGDKISSWSDLTGVASDATETDSNKQPTYKTNIQNGLPAVFFDGTLDRGLEGTFNRTNNGGLTIFLVGRFTDVGRRAFFEFYKTGGGTSPGDPRGFFFTYGFNDASVDYNLDSTTFNVWSAYDTGTNTDFWENGSLVYSNFSNWGNTSFTGSGSYVLGDDQTGGDRLNGYIGEFLVFDRQLSAAEMSTLENYLKNKWGTP